MERLGYAVAKFANDGFALLRGDRMLPKPGSGSVVVEKSGMLTSSSGSSSGHESNSGRSYNSNQEKVDRQQGLGAPTADISLSSNDLRGPPEDEDPVP